LKVLEAMAAASAATDVPSYWVSQLLRVRKYLDHAGRLEEGSERIQTLVDAAQDIEEAAVRALLQVAA